MLSGSSQTIIRTAKYKSWRTELVNTLVNTIIRWLGIFWAHMGLDEMETVGKVTLDELFF